MSRISDIIVVYLVRCKSVKTEMVETVKKYTLYSLITLLSGAFIAVILMTAVWAIPDSLVKRGVNDAENRYRQEGTYDHEIQFFCYTYGSKLIADKPMTDVALNGDQTLTPLERGMSVNGYSRYWHGYMTFFRPFLTIFEYGQIRYIMSLLFLLLIALIVTKLQERTDKAVSIAFILSLGVIHFAVVPFALHAGIAFYVAFTSSVVVLHLYNGDRTGLWRWMFYLISGMCMSFFDLLTDPVAGLALPLLFELILDEYADKSTDIKKQLMKCISASFAWVLGYGLFWAEKWLLGSLILRKNVLGNATGKVGQWLEKSENGGVLWAIQKNLFCLFPSGEGVGELIPFFVIYTLLLLGLTIVFIRKHDSLDRIKRLIPILFVSAYPYFWMIVMSDHSTIHATFWVYRTQLCSVFGGLALFFMSLKRRK